MKQSMNTNSLFVGGNGMFLEYHDIVKPVWLYAVISLIMNKYDVLPVNIIANMPIGCIIEWYKNRRYRNPLKQLDWKHQLDEKELDELMKSILKDKTIYTMTPLLQIEIFLEIYKKQSMVFPFYIYSEEYEEGIDNDVNNIFQGVTHKYLYGDLRKCLERCDENFTYIFSDISKVKNAAEILLGSYSHILISEDYRYNYNRKEMKIDLKETMRTHPFIRLGTTHVFDINHISKDWMNISQMEG